MKHRLVLSSLWCYCFDGTDYDDFIDYNNLNDLLDAIVDDMADEYYDSDVFPIIATRNIRNTLDYKFIVDTLNETAFERKVEYLFNDDEYYSKIQYPSWMLMSW